MQVFIQVSKLPRPKVVTSSVLRPRFVGLQQIKKFSTASEISKWNFAVLEIGGMTCASCMKRVETAIESTQSQVPVQRVDINLNTGKAFIYFSKPEASMDVNQIPLPWLQSVKQKGYRGQLLRVGGPDVNAINLQSSTATKGEPEKSNLLLASALTLPIFLTHMNILQPIVSLFSPSFAEHFSCHSTFSSMLSTPVVFWCGREFFKRSVLLAKSGETSMDTLVALGAGSAYFSSVASLLGLFPSGGTLYFETASVITTLILFGRYMENNAKLRANSQVQSLLAMQPTIAHKLIKVSAQATKLVDVPIESIEPGDILEVLPGERIPADGVYLEDRGSVDEAMLSGESLPVTKKAGDRVYAGTVNIGEGIGNEKRALTFVAEQTGTHTMLNRIIDMVERAQSSKAPIQRIADRVSARFVPFVITASSGTFAWWALRGYPISTALETAISVMVIACPCALGLATPTAIQASTGTAAASGFLVRRAESLENAAKISTLFLDKTGTLTNGKPHVTDIKWAHDGTFDNEQALCTIKQIEERSEHPLAKAFVNHCKRIEPLPLRIKDIKSVVGSGIYASVNEEPVYIGTLKFLLEKGVSEEETSKLNTIAAPLIEQGKTCWFITINGKAICVVGFLDTLRSSAKQFIDTIKSRGIEPVLISGDRSAVAKITAEKLGIERLYGELTPQEKLEIVKKEQNTTGKVVGMVGDGVNDAPALAQADVSWSIGLSGTAVAMETADITLVTEDLNKITESIDLSKKTLKVIKQNLFWAFIYNAISVPFAAVGLLKPEVASASMALSSLSVVTNSLRLTRKKKQ